MVTTALALFATSFVFIVTEYVVLRSSMVNNAMGIGRTIASNVVANLSFSDNLSAQETLSTLRSVPGISAAAIYDNSGNLFAGYGKEAYRMAAKITIPKQETYNFERSHVDTYTQVVLDKEIIGCVFIRSDISSFYTRVKSYIVVLLVVMSLALLLSYFMFSKLLQKGILIPFGRLMKVMNAVSNEKDYSLRAEITTGDEIAFFAHGLNDMLSKIQARDEELESYRKSLEELVERRTIQLSNTNIQLKEELAERQRIERALTESEQRYRTIFETTGTASMIIEGDDTISLVNSGFEKLSGFYRQEVERKKQWTDFFQDKSVEDLLAMCHMQNDSSNDSTAEGCETIFIDSTGISHDVYLSIAPIPDSTHSVASILDLTELKRLEAQLLQSQKMEAIGQLAGGVAHDFNNVLSAIIGYGNLLLEKLSENEPARTDMKTILSAADKAAQLTAGLLAFSRKQIITPKTIDINVIAKKAGLLLSRLLTEDIELDISCATKPIHIFGDQTQFEQILINLATNARDAMPTGGVFSIKTDIVSWPKTSTDLLHHGPSEHCALIAISDTGAGMSKETQKRIFEPFYTTKEVGKGTGLGLSIVYGVVSQHNGEIEVISELGVGTQFRIYLPLTHMPIKEEPIAEEQTPVGGNETIMVVEDDIVTRMLSTEVLKKYGYYVVEAEDGEDAVEKYTECHGSVDLVILDVIMPKKNGKATYDEMKALNKNLKALFVSGYTSDIMEEKGFSGDTINFLSKPIVPKILAAKVRAVLDA
jgi:PAS domain S-box-containing protein